MNLLQKMGQDSKGSPVLTPLMTIYISDIFVYSVLRLAIVVSSSARIDTNLALQKTIGLF